MISLEFFSLIKFLMVLHSIEDGANGSQKEELLCNWDPYNSVIISEFEGKVMLDDVKEGQLLILRI